MTDKDPDHSHDDDLRRRAESRACDDEPRPDDLEVRSPEETHELLHELRVQQIELQMQNEELQRTQTELEASRARYLDLYDRAPVGYCVLSETGLILEANLTAADLLGTARSALIKQPLSRFILKEGQDIYYRHHKQLFETSEPQESELRLVRPDGTPFWAHLMATATRAEDGAPVCRLVLSDITERKQAAEALRKTEKRHKDAERTAHLGSWEMDIATGDAIWSDEFFRICGYEPGSIEPSSETGFQIIHPDDRDRAAEAVNEALETGNPYGIEKRIVRPDGTVRWVHSIGEITYDRQGEPKTLLGSFHDITERKQAAEALQNSEQYLRTILQTTVDGFWVTNTAGEFLDINEAYCAMSGYTREEILRLHISDVDVLEDPAATAARIERVIENGDEVFETRHRRKDGSIFDTEVSVTYLDSAGGKLICFCRDITERKQSEAMLAESELRFRQIYNHMHIGIAQISLQSIIEHANPAYCQMLGYTEAELQGKHLREITHQDTVEEELQKQTQLARGEIDHYQMEKRFIHKDGHTVYGILDANLIRDAAGEPHYFLGSVLDITQRKKLEQQLHQQARLAAVGQLAAGIAHDFRNRLTTIILYSQLSQHNHDLPPKVAHALDIILSESRKATDLVQQILDFSSRATATLRPLNLAATVDHIATTLQRTLPETIRLSVSRGTADYTIEGDAGRIEQVLMNLALNSRDAMPNGGELRLTLSRFQLSPHAKPPVPEMPPGAWICLSVSDKGSGMTEEAYAHLFEPFFTTKEVGQGTGLGLAQVYGIVRLHNGFINVTTRQGEGTTVNIYVPAADNVPKHDREEDLTALLGGEETILLVEDNDRLRESGQSLLEDLGYRVITAANGLKALSAFAKADPPVDLLLTDIIMPEMGGKALLEELRRQAPHLRALGITGYPLQDNLEALLKAGFVEVLPKPFEIGELAHAIRRALTTS
jgi:two-component system, cell cycle sensor histidine kinase and response regulator CckA